MRILIGFFFCLDLAAQFSSGGIQAVTVLPATCSVKQTFNYLGTLYTCPSGVPVASGGGTSGNATSVNGASVPTSQSCLGSNGSGQLVPGTSCAAASLGRTSQMSGITLDGACTLDGNNKCTPGTITGTDNLAAINSFFSNGAATHELVIDGPLGVKGAINVGAVPNTTIRCIGSGAIYSLNGSNSNGIQNGVPLPFDPGPTAPARVAGSLLLDGCTQYVNRFTYGTSAGNSTIPSNGVIHTAAAGGAANERGGLGGYTVGSLASTINSAVTAFTLVAAVPAVLPQTTNYVIDTEILNCTAYSGAVVSGCTRGGSVSGWSGQSAAASHTSGAAAGTFTWYTGLNLVNLANVNIRNWHVFDSPSYGIKCDNCGPVNIDDSWIEFSVATSQAPNADGIHIDGPAGDVHVNGVTYTLTGDDAFALNLDEGYAGAGVRLQASNMTCDRCAVGMRIYGDAQQVSSVNVSAFSGSFRDKYIILGCAGCNTLTADGVKSVTVDNAFITSQSGNTMTEAVEISGNVGTVALNNVTWSDPNAAATTWFKTRAGSLNVSDLQLTNSKIYQTTVGSGTPSIVCSQSGDTVKKLTINNYRVTQQAANSFTAVPFLIDTSCGGTYTQVAVNGLDPTNIGNLANAGSYTGITQVWGTGLIETGFQIPDSVVTKAGQTYISSTGQVPSVLWNGLAKSICATCAGSTGGAIVGSISANTITTDNLTTMGTSDWIGVFTVGNHTSPFTIVPNQRKSTGGSQISNVVGTARGNITDNVNQSSGGSALTLSWTDGTPTSSGSDTAYVWATSGGNFPQNFAFTLPAGTGTHTAYVYVNQFQCSTATFTAALSDSSSAPYTDTSLSSVSALNFGRYKVVYNAASNSQTLNVTWACSAGSASSILMMQGVALQ